MVKKELEAIKQHRKSTNDYQLLVIPFKNSTLMKIQRYATKFQIGRNDFINELIITAFDYNLKTLFKLTALRLSNRSDNYIYERK